MTKTFIRKLNPQKDLLKAANLIELCFGIHLDDDGNKYLQQIRKAARDKKYIHWTRVKGESVSYPLHGFIWEENGIIAGNLSLIPFFWKQNWYYLIANVAVHPDFRRRGIASQLTLNAINHIEKLGIKNIWLHVREDNYIATNLYKSLSFVDKFSRDTWQSKRSSHYNRIPEIDLKITKRRKQDWKNQVSWLCDNYPDEVAWYFSLKLKNYKPGLINSMQNFMRDKPIKQWAVRQSGQLIGAATWEPGYQRADSLWLAIHPLKENQVIEVL
ncbi:MAG: GNAT family N-acetyltransferase, partial [Anaerolineaceae bacterium]|nr:GNAT family N-acetyltransferase [Anaerolineaceae bacterium]